MKPPRRLKNKSAVRRVPIHSKLIRLGFLHYVEQRRSVGDERIFPNLEPGGADGRLGHGFTKWFTRYRRDTDVYEDGRDFHFFRHSASTFLHQAGAADSIVDRLTGHTTPGESAHYTPVRARTAPDVRRRFSYAIWHTDCARFVWGLFVCPCPYNRAV
jgi:integrase